MCLLLLARHFSKQHPSGINKDKAPTLLRDFIHDSLYNKEYGYFNSKEIINPNCSIKFRELKNQDNYLDVLNDLYKKGPTHAWLTPVEVFQPWYGQALAKYMVELIYAQFFRVNNTVSESVIQIFEIGIILEILF
jgi:hypothetical protein